VKDGTNDASLFYVTLPPCLNDESILLNLCTGVIVVHCDDVSSKPACKPATVFENIKCQMLKVKIGKET
jgi:hypothetical protein